jgi:hypothetical protein
MGIVFLRDKRFDAPTSSADFTMNIDSRKSLLGARMEFWRNTAQAKGCPINGGSD